MNSEWPTDIERELLADACANSYWLFLKYAFGVALNPRGRWLSDSVHQDICRVLQRKAMNWLARRARGEQGREKFMAIIPRGFGKTVSITKSFPMWCQLQDPDLAVVIDSESAAKSEDFAGSIKTVYEGGDPFALFTWLYGNWHDPSRLWRDAKFTHACRRQLALTEPSFATTSVEKGATGSHPDMLVVDDPISQERIRDQGNWIDLAVRHVHALIPALRTDSFQLVVGTPYTNNDVLNTLVQEDGIYEAYGMKLPILFPEPSRTSGQWTVYFMQARDRTGASTLPEAWSGDELDDYENKRPMDFAAQMMCTPGVGEHMPIVQKQIDELWVDKRDVPANLIYSIHMDTAFKDQRRQASGDDSVIEVWGHDVNQRGDVYFIEGHGSNSWRLEDFCDELVKIVQRYRKLMRRVKALTDERIIGGKDGTWESVLRNYFSNAGMYLPPFHQISRAGTKKVARITEAAGYWVDGRVHLVRNAPGVGKLVRQMLQIGVSAHDDWADAGADVFHPSVYRPALPGGTETVEPEVLSGFDRYLKTGRLDDQGAREAYDLSREIEKWEDAAVW